MINLLPPHVKNSYRFARHNQALRHWIVALALILVGLGLIGSYGLLTIHESAKHFQDQVAAGQAELKKNNVDVTNKDLKQFNTSLSLAVKVLDQEVLFSKLITQIGTAIPKGVSLTGLQINQLGGGLDLTAAADNYADATQTQVNLSDPSKDLFSKVDIVNINCGSQSSPSQGALCTAQFRALFNINNQFLFINQGKKPKP